MTLPLNMDRRALMSLAAGTVGALALRAQTAPRDFGPNASPVRYPDPDILTLDPRFKKYAIGNAPIQRVATGFLWAEGPAWNGVGRYLMWSDIPNDRQMRLLDEDGHVSVLRKPAGFSNGNTFDGQGRQISCEHGNRRVVRYEYDGTFTVLAKEFNGKRFNAPNDAVVHPVTGDIWFTDPGYGSLGDYEGQKGPLELKEAVYRIDAKTGTVHMVTDEVFKPNGLCFSPDLKTLYVADTGSSHYPKAPKNILKYQVNSETTLGKASEFTSMAMELDG
ncbi:MAG: SMP-30/gluconolactonase/LRE family protein, partial [Planctomycetota bacterium]